MDNEPQLQVLKVGAAQVSAPIVKLRDYGFDGAVSKEARDEIKDNDVRAGLVLTTAAKFAFR